MLGGIMRCRFLYSVLVLCCFAAPLVSAQSAVLCGKLNDGLVYLAPNWDSFTPPATGQSYVDQVFGCPVKRLTNSATDETAWDGKYLGFMHYYSTFTPINATDTMVFIVSSDGMWSIKDLNG